MSVVMQLIIVLEALLRPLLVLSIEKFRRLLGRTFFCLYSGKLMCHLWLSIVLSRRSLILHVERVDPVVFAVQCD